MRYNFAAMKKALLIISVWSSAFCLNAQDVSEVKPLDESGNDLTVTAFTLDNANNKYVGTSAGLILVEENGAVEQIYTKGPVHSVVWHNTHGVWIATDNNVVINPETEQRVELSGDSVRISAMTMSGSQIWVGTNNGVYVISTQQADVIDHFTADNSKLLSDQVNDVFVDPSRVKWIATPRGVARVEDKKWRIYEKDHAFNAITGNSEGVWLAAEEEMWLVDPFNRWAPTGVKENLSLGEVRALAADAKGRIYILSDVLVQFDPYTDEAIEVETQYSLQEGRETAIIFDLDDKLWLGSLEYGLVAMDFKPEGERELTAYVSAQNPICNGESNGTLKVTATGGVPPYRYSWSGSDLSGMNPSGVAAGRYGVTVTDSEGGTYAVDVQMYEPDPLGVQVSYDEVSRRGVAKATGGTGGYSYLWSDGSNGRELVLENAVEYRVEVTDNAGCVASGSYMAPTVEVTVSEPVIEEQTMQKTQSAEGLDAIDAGVLLELDAATLAVGQTLRIEQLYFDADSSTIKTRSFKVLDEVYEFLSENDRIVIEIGGHTNGLPDHAYCDRLSTARASSVADYLFSKGIPQNRIASKGYGKRNPIASNGTVEGRVKNQRVEIKILQI